jgi:hypothetical protein
MLPAAQKWHWLHKDFLLGMFEQDSHKAKKQYKSFVQCEEPPEATGFLGVKTSLRFLALEILLNG